jgi:hypothetical protein
MTEDPDAPQSPLRIRAYAAATDLGLDRNERVELSEMLLKIDVSSWRALTEEQMQRVADALEGARLVAVLRQLRA